MKDNSKIFQKACLELEEEYKKQTNALFLDSLTGLFNHGFFQISLDREIERSLRYGSPFTLAIIDIDSFSIYNKRYGPLKGDRALKEIAKLIKKNIRRSDLAARYSADIFTVILIKCDHKSFLSAVEKIRESVERLSDGILTVSIGLVAFPEDATNKENLFKKAQEALLQAKIEGKNRIKFFEKEKRLLVDQKSTILVVDDQPSNTELLEELLVPLNYVVLRSSRGESALSYINKINVDLVLLDINMPGMNGYEVCRRLKGSEATRLIPVIMITGLDDRDVKLKGIEAGADDFITKPLNKLELLARIKSLTKAKILNDHLTSIENVLISLANAVEAKDNYTQGHIQRVANIAITLAKKMDLSEKEIEAVRLGGILHDIGKIGIPLEVLNKPGQLNPHEWEVLQTHPDVGYKICLPLKNNLGSALEVIRHHHEKLDGSGYPDGLKGEEISMVARVMAVVDIYDALVTDRPYREGMSKEKAEAILYQEADEGKLDQTVVKCLLEMLRGRERDHVKVNHKYKIFNNLCDDPINL